ncbi:MAG: hypothetical protein CVT49_03870 [candidate division Zixibacteria bacterium HGW-Zixibacteria-1]|nr:MAG: hypothetical protein CVT49_03870 [candidate division Zixibacteria bacterium HGW-Zixibacteria-1]
MPISRKSLRTVILTPLSFIIIVLCFASSAFAQFYILDVNVSEISAREGRQNVAIPIYMRNYIDSVVAFELTFVTDRPDLIQFNTVNCDTTGTLTSGWQFISVDTAYESGLEIQAMANTIQMPIVHGIGYPQTGKIPLIKILVDIGDLPDTAQTQTASIEIMANIYDFCFSNEKGQTIGLNYELYYDTLWYNCIAWYPGDTICKTWEEVGGPPADTMVIDSLHPYLDTTQVGISNGSVTVLQNCLSSAGDADCSGYLNLLDAVFIINYLYKSGPAPVCNADCNCDCLMNLLDVTCMISYLYNVGTECNCCNCEQWNIDCGAGGGSN